MNFVNKKNGPLGHKKKVFGSKRQLDIKKYGGKRRLEKKVFGSKRQRDIKKHGGRIKSLRECTQKNKISYI